MFIRIRVFSITYNITYGSFTLFPPDHVLYMYLFLNLLTWLTRTSRVVFPQGTLISGLIRLWMVVEFAIQFHDP